VLIKAANLADGSPIDVPEVIQSTYAKDVNMQKAELQLRMLPDLVKAYKESQGLPKLTVTRISTISDIIVNVPIAREMFSKIVRLLRLYLTILVTTATAERSFSSLRRIKTYFRSTMTEQHLNNILLLHAHKEMTDALNLTEIARLFVSSNAQRVEFFGNFV